MPRRLNASAIAAGQFSSRWNRMVRGIGLPLPESVAEPTGILPLDFGPMVVVLLDVGVDFGFVVVIVSQRRMHIRKSDGAISRDDLVGAHPPVIFMIKWALPEWHPVKPELVG